jgi:hypothetical protein
MSEEIISGAELRRKARRRVTCPETDNKYLMRRTSMAVLLRSNTLPENFVSKTLIELGGAEQQERALTDNDLRLLEDAAQIVITAAMLSPRIVENAEAEDETEYEDIPQGDRRYLYAWVKGEVPDSPVETIEGEGVTVEAVQTFPDGEGSDTVAVSGPDGEARGDEALATT